jgi:hypothetical protein
LSLKSFIHSFLLIFLSGCIGSGVQFAGVGETSTAQTNSLTGKLTYDFVPIQDGIGLNYSATTQKPLRKIYLEAIDSNTNFVVASSATNNLGEFKLKIPKSSSMVYLRIHAEIKSPSVLVQDNTQNNTKYIVETDSDPVTNDINIGTMNLTSGWDSNTNAYISAERVAAPFAILDTILTAFEKVQAAKPSLVFPQLKINWSENNTRVPGNNNSLGHIGSSKYSLGELYILGKDGVDTDEYDTHVMVHEWGHYFEDKLGRSNSPGGNHEPGEIKDMSLAFGEGFGNALSAMIMDPDVTYRDSLGLAQASVGGMNLESDSNINPGWFSETSVEQILFDIYDSTNDAGDTVSLGLGPIIDIMTTHQKTTRASTSIFSFINGLKTKYPSYSTAINTLTTSKSITPIQDDFGTGETHNGGWSYNLPVYNQITVGGGFSTVKLQGNGLIDNDLNNSRYFYFIATSSNTRIEWESDNSYYAQLFDGNEFLGSSEQQYAGSMLTGSEDVSTVVGRIYRIKVFTEQGYVLGTSSFDFRIRADNI